LGAEAARLVAGFGLMELGLVLGHPTLGPLSPKFEGTRFHLSTHQLDDLTG
jgi:hypothetical protein